jgi:DNA-binding transcriptional ArsR family regulator
MALTQQNELQHSWPGCTLARQLLAPVRLFIVTFLVDMRWREFQFVCESIDVKRSSFEYHVDVLRRERILQTRRGRGRQMWVRLTPDGSRRLVDHLEATQAIVTQAREVLATSVNQTQIGPPRAPHHTLGERSVLTPEAVSHLVDQYESGATIEAIAKETGYSYRRTRTSLIEAGVNLRPPRIQVPPCPPGFVNLYQNGASIRMVSSRYGVSYNQARNMLLQAGVTLRPPGQSSKQRRHR